MKDLNELVGLKEEFEKKVKAEGKKLINDALQAVFEKFPNLTAIRWRQYTPYFNDGEACVFGVGEISFKLKGVENEDGEEGGDYGDGFLSDYDISDYVGHKRVEKPEYKGLLGEIESLNKSFSKVEECLQMVFGDHACVTAYPGGKVEVEEYEHD